MLCYPRNRLEFERFRRWLTTVSRRRRSPRCDCLPDVSFNHACTNGTSIIITHMEYHHYRRTKYRRFRALNVPKYEHSSRTTQYNLLCPRMLVYVPCVLIWRYSILNKQESAVFTLGTRLSRFSRHFVSSLGQSRWNGSFELELDLF